MEPIMAVWAGYALGGTSVAEADLGPYIQQAKDQVRTCTNRTRPIRLSPTLLDQLCHR